MSWTSDSFFQCEIIFFKQGAADMLNQSICKNKSGIHSVSASVDV